MELAACGIGDIQPEDTETLIEASMNITNGFIDTMKEYMEISLDYAYFKKFADESLTTAYEEISEANSV